jgi:hypothetical protein
VRIRYDRLGYRYCLFFNLEKLRFSKVIKALWVPPSFSEGNLGSAKFFGVILGSAASKRLKNTGVDYGVTKSYVLLLHPIY